MNAKAERIEQIVQIINRNLLLIENHSDELVELPQGSKKARSMINEAFGNDKFAFEMAHFIKSEKEKIQSTSAESSLALADIWNGNFVKGLESLLFECAIVKDEIERNCFISRIYVWFNEKLLERRDLPRAGGLSLAGFQNLRSSIANSGGDHSLTAIDNYANKVINNGNDSPNGDMNNIDNNGGINNDQQMPTPSFTRPFSSPQSDVTKMALPLYVKHAYPAIMKPKSAGFSVGRIKGPHIPSVDENYGLLHHVPETEAEKTMHTLWLSRRRQEAFEWKSQQQLAVVMDRLAFHKSRLESDALRRQESSHVLEVIRNSRPNSASNMTVTRPLTTDGPKFAVKMLRPTSSKYQKHNAPPRTREQREEDEAKLENEKQKDLEIVDHDDDDDDEDDDEIIEKDSELPILVKKSDVDVKSKVQRISKTNTKKPEPPLLPMRFKTETSEAAYRRHAQFKQEQTEQTEYMMGYNSDEDDNKINTMTTGSTVVYKNTSSSKSNKNINSTSISERRERPKSANAFRDVVNNDPELMVHYRQSNFRRMPLGPEHHSFLDHQELIRKQAEAKKREEAAAAAAASKDKGKDKDKAGKGGDKDKGGKGGKKDKNAKTEEPIEPIEEIKYPREHYVQKAQEFMDKYMKEKIGVWNQEGPTRTWQLLEVDKISQTFKAVQNDKDKTPLIRLKDDAQSLEKIKRVLVVPQDKPDAICQEQLRNPQAGLMENPLPKEFWRKQVSDGGGKKKGGKGKKKK